MKKFYFVILTCLLCLSACDLDNKHKFIRQSGNKLVQGIDDEIIMLRGVTFANNVFDWNFKEVPDTHHAEIDYKRIKDMGMNTVRFFMNYKTFEDDSNPYKYKQSGWDWIDQNIKWAKKYNINLILNMHVPQGGWQSFREGWALWEDVENQNRLTNLWSAIAKRYKDENIIAAYDLINEPCPTQGVDQWKLLAQRIIDNIRSVDTNHLIVVSETLDREKFLVNDNNILYDVHFYDPLEYTHQLLDNNPYYSIYPNEDYYIFPFDLEWKTAIFSNPALPSGDTDWTYYEGELYQITDNEIIYGEISIEAKNNSGNFYIDNITVDEYDENQNFVRTIRNLNITTTEGWDIWSANGDGSFWLAQIGKDDNVSIQTSGTTGDTTIYNWQSGFAPKQGYYYQVNGWLKGNNIAADSICRLRIEFLKSFSGQKVMQFNKDYLEKKLQEQIEFATTNNVPVTIGEFGVFNANYQNNYGGYNWTQDMLDLLKKYNLHFHYHAYHESGFGIYSNDDGLPDPDQANDRLINILTEALK